MSEEIEKPRRIIEQQIEFVMPGMELARNVFSDDGTILLNEKTILTKGSVKSLNNRGIRKVSIFEEVSVNPIIDPKVQKFINEYNQSVTVVQKAFDTLRATKEVPVDVFVQTADTISQSISEAGNIVDQLYILPEQCDDATYQHSVNVSVIAALIATWLRYPPDVVNAISLAGLMHDVGKSQLPKHLLNAGRPLLPEEYEHYKQHTVFGKQLVNDVTGVSQSVISGIAEHHEREDASGYPNGLSSEDIHPYAKIVAIADLYDEALTINQDNTVLFTPYTSLEKLRTELFRLEPKACLTFITNMTDYLSCNKVALTNGCRCRVVCVNKEQPSRSIVQLETGIVIDLLEKDNIYIHHVIRDSESNA